MDTLLYQKVGVTVSYLAQELLALNEGDRIAPISDYQEKYQVSRGTIQNAFNYLKESKAVDLRSRGHMGTFIEHMVCTELQKLCRKKELMGIMPLPYSLSYEGLATAIYHELRGLDFNMAYIRGAESRIRLVETGVYDFLICSQHAAEDAIRSGRQIEIIYNFGIGTYLSRHVLVLKDPDKTEIEDGMHVAYDSTSYDQREITKELVKGRKDITLVEMRAHQTVAAIQEGMIEAGVWNYDEILENGHTDMNIVCIGGDKYIDSFSAAVLAVNQREKSMASMLCKFINKEEVIQIQKDVKCGKKARNF